MGNALETSRADRLDGVLRTLHRDGVNDWCRYIEIKVRVTENEVERIERYLESLRALLERSPGAQPLSHTERPSAVTTMATRAP